MEITKYGFAVIEGDQYIGKWAKEHGRLDHDQSALSSILPFINEGDTVLDLGALYGDHTIAYAEKVGREGFVHAFEPNPKAYECLEYNTRHLVQVNPIPYGVGKDATEKYIIDYNIDNVGASRLKPDERGERNIVLDNADLPACHFIKLDIEGFEVEALLGAKNLIKKFSPILVIEVNKSTLESRGYSENTLLSLLETMGYSYRNIYEEQPIGGDQYDIICFKK